MNSEGTECRKPLNQSHPNKQEEPSQAKLEREFKNVILVINGYCETLLNSEGLSAIQHDVVREIFAAGSRAEKIAALLFNHPSDLPETGMLLDLAGVLDHTEAAIRILLGEKVVFSVVKQNFLPWVAMEKEVVEQTLFTLAIQARDKLPPGGKLTIVAKKILLKEEYVRLNPKTTAGEYVQLAVETSGPKNPCEPLVAAVKPDSTLGNESGIICRDLEKLDRIVRKNHGWLQIESVPDGGNRVSLFLPIEAKQPVQGIEEAKSVIVQGGKESILVVEDDESVRLLTVSVLQKSGYRVLNAASAEEALEVWKRHSGRPALLLTDLVMPGNVSGKELAEKLEAQKPSLKVIYASGYSASVCAELFKMEPGFEFIQKPFRPSKLTELVRKVLDSDKVST
ncbi:MAG: Blue-light-activated protein [Verrucomicrobiales bacterium]|nr:Blue-light-activated protein [Verrucomicrobiales bacterium]